MSDLKLAVIGVDHRHIYGQLAGMLELGCTCKGWWTEGDPQPVEGFLKRFPDIPRVADRRELLDDPEIDLVLIADIPADPAAWGDVVLSRSDAPSSYHLSVVTDDAAQGITHVVRGLDLYHATAIHRLLQELLGLPAPVYHHHRLILGPDGRKLSKSNGDTALRQLRAEGRSVADIRVLLGI